jgi:hypothetical protein
VQKKHLSLHSHPLKPPKDFGMLLSERSVPRTIGSEWGLPTHTWTALVWSLHTAVTGGLGLKPILSRVEMGALRHPSHSTVTALAHSLGTWLVSREYL